MYCILVRVYDGLIWSGLAGFDMSWHGYYGPERIITIRDDFMWLMSRIREVQDEKNSVMVWIWNTIRNDPNSDHRLSRAGLTLGIFFKPLNYEHHGYNT
jgi:hypothetical protein